MKKVEFHVHTRLSEDSSLNKYFILLMCKIKKIDCVAITDHNEIKGAQKYKEFLEKHGVAVIVGEEIFTTSGEIIGLFLKERISPNLSVQKTIEEIEIQNGLVYVPHPYDEKRYKTVLETEEIIKHKDKIDFIEIHNGRNIKREFSSKQKEIADRLELLNIVGSDSHVFFELGRNFMYLDSIEKDKIIDSVRKGGMKKADCIRLAHSYTKFKKLTNYILRGDFSGLYRSIHKNCERKM